MDDGAFFFEPELDSGVFAAANQGDAGALAARARYAVAADVAAVVDLTGSVARLGIAGSPVELSDDKQAVLMAWMQEVETRVVRSTPPKLALAFGSHELLVIPIHSPAALVGVIAVSLPCAVRRPATVLEALAAEWALTLEAAERRSSRVARARSEAETEPAPPPEAEIEYAVIHAGRW
ncbi:MAG: hypothetical protein IT375_26340 [Polyangiaceae bacterium]|jgi:hypothetical protein|nr:hypothetical protein [Polyangiaceae bacterium]MCK6537193.1 hypothetical protein [Polyangiaceae bacterium]